MGHSLAWETHHLPGMNLRTLISWSWMWCQVLKGTDRSALSPSIVTSYTIRENQRWCLANGKFVFLAGEQLDSCPGRWHGPVSCQWCLSGYSCFCAKSGVFVRLQSIRGFMLGFLFNLHHLLLFSCWIESTKGRNSTMFALVQRISSAAKKPFNMGYCVHIRTSNVMMLSLRRGESLTLPFYDFSSSWEWEPWEWLQDHCSC